MAAGGARSFMGLGGGLECTRVAAAMSIEPASPCRPGCLPQCLSNLST